MEIRMSMSKITVLALAVILVTAGCSHTESSGRTTDHAPAFAVKPDEAKVFVYAYYATPQDKPYFGETFRVHVEGGYREEITAEQYMDAKILPGYTTITVDQVGWGGDVISHATFKARFEAGIPSFAAVRVAWDEKTKGEKAEIVLVDHPTGISNITGRTRVCSC